MTHTFVELEISHAAYFEIKDKLKAAGYHHAFVGDAIDMHGIGLVLPRLPERRPCPVRTAEERRKDLGL